MRAATRIVSEIARILSFTIAVIENPKEWRRAHRSSAQYRLTGAHLLSSQPNYGGRNSLVPKLQL